MLNLNQYIRIYEGGQAGHMAHPYDYTDFTGNDLIDLIDNLFSGKITHIKEKLDGFNIMATMNNDNEVVFIRNKSNLNSPKGGMSIDDMLEKWADNEHQRKVFSQSALIITKIFKKLGSNYFNPNNTTRKVINCECIVSGKTNIMPYATDRVAFHGYQIYMLVNSKYELQKDIEGHVEDIYDIAEDIDEAKPRPDLVIKSVKEANKLYSIYKKKIIDLFDSENLKLDSTIEDWKLFRFKKFAPDWFKDDIDVFNRICNDNKSVKLTELKRRYPNYKDDISKLDKEYKKDLCSKIMDPLDSLFLNIGNDLIDLLDNFVNTNNKDQVIQSLKKDIQDTVDIVSKSDSQDTKDKVNKSLHRLEQLGNKYNSAEGVVFTYKNRRMKLTGSFAPINQLLGTKYKM